MALGLGFLGKIFGTEKAMNTMVEGAVGALDKLFYTDEEKAEDGRQERAAARAIVIDWMDKTKGQNIARRFLALIIAGTWLSQYWFIMTASVVSVWVDEQATAVKIELSIDKVLVSADGMTGAMMLILGFYFAAPHLGKVVDSAMARFGKGQGAVTQSS